LRFLGVPSKRSGKGRKKGDAKKNWGGEKRPTAGRGSYVLRKKVQKKRVSEKKTWQKGNVRWRRNLWLKRIARKEKRRSTLN